MSPSRIHCVLALLSALKHCSIADETHRSFYQQWFPQRGRVQADTMLAALDPSSWEFRAGASFCRPTLGCKHVAGAETDNPYALVHVLPVFSSLVCPKFLGQHRGFSCHCFPSLVERRELCPLYEWVSRRCRARTLPHLFAFVACTIRTWSRRTLRWMACQSMAYHSAASLETAPTACAVVICLASYADLPSSLV